MNLSEYKNGDRVKYVFLGDYDGTIINDHKKHGSPYLVIELDNRPPAEFNGGEFEVLALTADYLELISSGDSNNE
jgi:hypothetical protein